MNSIQFPFSNHTRKNFYVEYVIFIRFNQLEIEPAGQETGKDIAYIGIFFY
jgi:hypothetical protein